MHLFLVIAGVNGDDEHAVGVCMSVCVYVMYVL
jgi:hypothetical protein